MNARELRVNCQAVYEKEVLVGIAFYAPMGSEGEFFVYDFEKAMDEKRAKIRLGDEVIIFEILGKGENGIVSLRMKKKELSVLRTLSGDKTMEHKKEKIGWDYGVVAGFKIIFRLKEQTHQTSKITQAHNEIPQVL